GRQAGTGFRYLDSKTNSWCPLQYFQPSGLASVDHSDLVDEPLHIILGPLSAAIRNLENRFWSPSLIATEIPHHRGYFIICLAQLHLASPEMLVYAHGKGIGEVIIDGLNCMHPGFQIVMHPLRR